jgi:hypothetical protein
VESTEGFSSRCNDSTWAKNWEKRLWLGMEYVGSDQIAKPQKRETVDLTGFNGR